MKYVTEFRDPAAARVLGASILAAANTDRQYRIMEFCGGHTHAIFRFGVQDLLPDNVEFVHGPGCPVCVLPSSRIESALELVEEHGVILCTYGDVMRVPAAPGRSLLRAKAAGADIRMVLCVEQALAVARDNPHKEVVFFAIGFETTTPPTAIAVLQAAEQALANFSVHCNHVLTPAAIRHLVESPECRATGALHIDGFLGPSHVSTVIGSRPYEFVATEYRRPVVIAGFEPLDVMQSTLMLVRQINEGRSEVENEYARAVTEGGNAIAQGLTDEVFEVRRRFEWRGLGDVAASALKIRADYRDFDAEEKFDLRRYGSRETKSCLCPAILRGSAKPPDCKLFGNGCRPESPLGPCMVSSEGACAAYWTYRRHA